MSIFWKKAWEKKKESRFLDLHKTSVSCLYFYPKTVQCVHSWHPFSFHCFQLQDHVQNFINVLPFFQNLAVSNSNLKWVKRRFPTYEHGSKKIFFWSSPFPESFWECSLECFWNLWTWNHSLFPTWPTLENFSCVYSSSWFCLWSLPHSSPVSLKISTVQYKNRKS